MDAGNGGRARPVTVPNNTGISDRHGCRKCRCCRSIHLPPSMAVRTRASTTSPSRGEVFECSFCSAPLRLCVTLPDPISLDPRLRGDDRSSIPLCVLCGLCVIPLLPNVPSPVLRLTYMDVGNGARVGNTSIHDLSLKGRGEFPDLRFRGMTQHLPIPFTPQAAQTFTFAPASRKSLTPLSLNPKARDLLFLSQF
jgi:hypothetical protein